MWFKGEIKFYVTDVDDFLIMQHLSNARIACIFSTWYQCATSCYTLFPIANLKTAFWIGLCRGSSPLKHDHLVVVLCVQNIPETDGSNSKREHKRISESKKESRSSSILVPAKRAWQMPMMRWTSCNLLFPILNYNLELPFDCFWI